MKGSTPIWKKCLVLIARCLVLGVEKDKIKDQCVFQSKRLDQGEKKQTWHHDNSKLVLRNGDMGYALVSVYTWSNHSVLLIDE